MHWHLLVLLGTLLSTAVQAHQVIYQVVANPPPNASVGVAIGEYVYGLKADSDIPMLYHGPGPNNEPYRYVVYDGTNQLLDFESFERPAIQHAERTFNEVYNRPWNKLKLTELPQLYNFSSYSKNADPGASKLFDEGTIATLHFQAPNDELHNMHTNKIQKIKVTGTLTYINYDNIQQIEDVEIKIGGHSSRGWAKVPYKIKIPSTAEDGLHRRWELKLRSEATDPTMMREKIYSDLLKSTGVLAARGAYVRVYMNDTPIGLYLLMDDAGSESYIRETIHDGDPSVTLGAMIQGDAGKGEYSASFEFEGFDESLYDERVYDVKTEGPEGEGTAMKFLLQFMDFINQYEPSEQPNDVQALNVWQPKIDMVRYVRQMALEWIGGSWDAVIYSGNNFMLYRHPQTKQFIMVPMDFDYTFGNGLEADQRYIMTGTWQEFTSNRKPHSYLWEKVKATAFLEALYEQTLKEINDQLTNPDVLLKRIDSMVYFLQHDVAWDRSLDKMTAGLVKPWTTDDFVKSLNQGLGETDNLVGLEEWIKLKYNSTNTYFAAKTDEAQGQVAQ
ncbi:coth protein-domain-containing protein [Radiomyces spectabilis]|uniref:coth protein-domain-containing protein n=1 Tax=Radiomyces spectabilis TaxID=64574 RepID=UPI0022201C61|nr:coth protein-domain-containing protein [Radiomyces spectabilis]KAI8374262.1 coth protein-domain-containing protein [Radiomyces spectabilis]